MYETLTSTFSLFKRFRDGAGNAMFVPNVLFMVQAEVSGEPKDLHSYAYVNE
jgi:hypothetical protein